MVTNDTGRICFFCLGRIDSKGVRWREANNWVENPNADGKIDIYLHPECSIQLGLRLIGDGCEAEPPDADMERKIMLWTESRVMMPRWQAEEKLDE